MQLWVILHAGNKAYVYTYSLTIQTVTADSLRFFFTIIIAITVSVPNTYCYRLNDTASDTFVCKILLL
jgi:hypothetical protein